MTEFMYVAFAHRLVWAREVPMVYAQFLRNPDHVRKPRVTGASGANRWHDGFDVGDYRARMYRCAGR
jgi:hypothetical protein